MIAYHGTNEKAAESIKTTGFRAETWFARQLEHAFLYGGPCIFGVEFSDGPSMWSGEKWEDDWQFHTAIHIPTNKIISYGTIDVIL